MTLQRFLFRFVTLTLLLFVLKSSACQAADIQRVLILPVVNSAGVRDQAVLSTIDKALTAKFRTPLSSIVPVYHIIPSDEVSAAIQEVSNRKSGSLELNTVTLRYLSNKLNANFVIAAKVTAFRQDIVPALSLEADQHMRIHVAVSLYYYDRDSDRYTMVRDFREYIGDELPFSDSVYLTQELMDDLLAKLPLRSSRVSH